MKSFLSDANEMLFNSLFGSYTFPFKIHFNIVKIFANLFLKYPIFSDVRLRGLRPHHPRAGGSLRPPEGQPPLQPRPSQVLRQETLQVQQLQLCKLTPAS